MDYNGIMRILVSGYFLIFRIWFSNF